MLRNRLPDEIAEYPDPKLGSKECAHCLKQLPVSAFSNRRRHCRKCYYALHRLEIKDRVKEYYQLNKSKMLGYNKKYTRQRKEAVLKAYGGCCVCCGESLFELLTIDHLGPRGEGTAHRKRHGGSIRKVYQDIMDSGFPKNLYQVLCFNCNIAKGFYGICPHRRTNVTEQAS